MLKSNISQYQQFQKQLGYNNLTVDIILRIVCDLKFDYWLKQGKYRYLYYDYST